MPKLTDTQLVILNAAAQRDDLGVASLDKRAATREAVEALLKTKLLKLVPKTPDLALWAKTDDGAVGLVATPKALKALGIVEGTATRPASPSKSSTKPERARRGGTKLDAIVTLMRRTKGASIADMMSATDWQAHSVRGAISGALKKKLGLAVTSTREGEVRIYRIAA